MDRRGEADAATAGGLIRIFLEFRPALARLMTARGAASAEVEDLLQDLFLKIRQMSAEPVADPHAYLYRMAHNLLRDRYRVVERRSRREALWLEQQAPEASLPSSEAVLIGRQRLKYVADALDRLPERTREIFWRYRVEDEGQKAIARSLGISLSAVEKHLQRAYRVLLDTKRELIADSAEVRRDAPKGTDCDG